MGRPLSDFRQKDAEKPAAKVPKLKNSPIPKLQIGGTGVQLRKPATYKAARRGR